jgi:hypothetical protein
MQRLSRMIALALPLTALVAVGVAQTTDKSYFGTWKLNVAKSKYEPGPGPKEQTRIHEDAGNGEIRITTQGVGPQGNPTSTTYTYRLDGKDYPVTNTGKPPAGAPAPAGPNTIAFKAVDAYTVTFTQKTSDGKVVGTGSRTVSKDGKTMTITTKGTNQQGQPTSTSQVWEKQ